MCKFCPALVLPLMAAETPRMTELGLYCTNHYLNNLTLVSHLWVFCGNNLSKSNSCGAVLIAQPQESCWAEQWLCLTVFCCRATTYYLADRRYDMLPAVLSADLCSLLSGVDRWGLAIVLGRETFTSHPVSLLQELCALKITLQFCHR